MFWKFEGFPNPYKIFDFSKVSMLDKTAFITLNLDKIS